jgi:hypothetical protein
MFQLFFPSFQTANIWIKFIGYKIDFFIAVFFAMLNFSQKVERNFLPSNVK